MHACMHTYIHIAVHTHTHTCTHARMHTHTHTHTQVTRNVLKHVYEALQARKKMTSVTDGNTTSDLRLFCNNLTRECCTSEKKLALVTEKVVDDFYVQGMTAKDFADFIYTKVPICN